MQQQGLTVKHKKKGDNFYKRVSVEYFGKLLEFNFTKTSYLSPGCQRVGGDSVVKRRSNQEQEREPQEVIQTLQHVLKHPDQEPRT